MTHALKINPLPFGLINDGELNHLLIKVDRPFKIGDKLLLQEFEPELKVYTGKETEKMISLIEESEHNDGLKKGYAIISIQDLPPM